MDYSLLMGIHFPSRAAPQPAAEAQQHQQQQQRSNGAAAMAAAGGEDEARREGPGTGGRPTPTRLTPPVHGAAGAGEGARDFGIPSRKEARGRASNG
jgi:hypothetical protein